LIRLNFYVSDCVLTLGSRWNRIDCTRTRRKTRLAVAIGDFFPAAAERTGAVFSRCGEEGRHRFGGSRRGDKAGGVAPGAVQSATSSRAVSGARHRGAAARGAPRSQTPRWRAPPRCRPCRPVPRSSSAMLRRAHAANLPSHPVRRCPVRPRRGGPGARVTGDFGGPGQLWQPLQ
jgi:hypothetical protein